MSASNVFVKTNVNKESVGKKMTESIEYISGMIFPVASTSNEVAMAITISKILDDIKGVSYTVDSSGNILVTKGKKNVYPCFLSHMDTVHTYKNGFNVVFSPKLIKAHDNNGKSVGVGGDDKCGIVACLELLNRLKAVKVVFFTGEESGGTGSSAIDLSFFNDCAFIGSIDRWNGSDFIDNYYLEPSVSDYFKKQTTDILSYNNYKSNSGLFTDAFNLYDRGVNIPCFNMSCGYYQHHSADEFVYIPEMVHAIDTAEEIALAVTNRVELPKQQPKKYTYRSKYSAYGKWDDYDWKSYKTYKKEDKKACDGMCVDCKTDPCVVYDVSNKQYDTKVFGELCTCCGIEEAEPNSYMCAYCSNTLPF